MFAAQKQRGRPPKPKDARYTASIEVKVTPDMKKAVEEKTDNTSDFGRKAFELMLGERVLDVPEPALDNALRIELEPAEREKLEKLAKGLTYPSAAYLLELLARKSLKKFLWWFEQNRVAECGAREIRRFLAYIGNGHLQEGGRWGNAQLTKPASARTIQYYFNYLRGFFRWMVSERIIEDDPTRGLAVPKFEKHQIQPFTSEQLDALLNASQRLMNPRRDEAILTLMLDTGLRASELCDITMRDVELHTSYGQVTVIGKGKKKRTVPFDRTAARALWHYLRGSPPRDEFASLFQADRGTLTGAPLTRSGLLQLFERLGKEAGIKGVRCSPHTMRHTFAVMYLRGGGDVRALQRLLGHSDLKMTMNYLNIAEADVERQHRMSSPANRLRRK